MVKSTLVSSIIWSVPHVTTVPEEISRGYKNRVMQGQGV